MYVENLLNAANKVEDAQEEIDNIEQNISYLQDFLKEHKF